MAPRGPSFVFAKIGLAVLSVGFALSCREATVPEPPPPPPPTMAVQLIVTSASRHVDTDADGFPYMLCDFRIVAGLSGTGDGKWLDATFRWYWGLDRTQPSDSFVVPHADVAGSWGRDTFKLSTIQIADWRASGPLPFTLETTYRYTRIGGTDTTATARVPCGDSIPAGGAPSIRAFSFTSSRPAEPSDSLRVRYRDTTAAGSWFTYVAASGATQWDTVLAAPLQQQSNRAFRVPLPWNSSLDSSVRLVAVAVDQFDQQALARAQSSPLQDLTPPELRNIACIRTMCVHASVPRIWGGIYFTGEELPFEVIATDNHVLSSVSWHVSPAGLDDSVALHAPSAQVDGHVPVASEWAGTVQRLQVHARDSVGLVSNTVRTDSIGFRIYPTIDAPLTAGGRLNGSTEVHLDSKHGLLFVSRGALMEAWSLGTLQRIDTIIVPGNVVSSDLSASNDTLVAAMPALHQLAVIRTGNLGGAVSVIDVAGHSGTAEPVLVRLLSNGHAMVGMSGTTWHLHDVDLSTGTSRARTDAADHGAVVQMITSIDRERLIVYTGACVEVYDVATDTFGPCRVLPTPGYPHADLHGDHIVLGRDVYDASLHLISHAETADSAAEWNSLISPDGTTLYQSVGNGVGIERTRVSDGALIDRIMLGAEGPMLQTDDGASLAVLSGYYGAAYLIDMRPQAAPLQTRPGHTGHPNVRVTEPDAEVARARLRARMRRHVSAKTMAPRSSH
jgi:hypothetical protein